MDMDMITGHGNREFDMDMVSFMYMNFGHGHSHATDMKDMGAPIAEIPLLTSLSSDRTGNGNCLVVFG
jgi:hypothetical protein